MPGDQQIPSVGPAIGRALLACLRENTASWLQPLVVGLAASCSMLLVAGMTTAPANVTLAARLAGVLPLLIGMLAPPQPFLYITW